MKPSTRLLHQPRCPDDPWRPLSTPIYQTATFEQASATECGPYDYSRSGNPTRAVLENQLAALEHAERAFAYSSGLGALSAVLRLLPAGSDIIAGNDLYGGTHRLLTQVAPRLGLSCRFIDTSDPGAVADELMPQTRLVLVETPTNPLQNITDLRALAAVTRSRGVLLAVDNSLLSPYLQNPLDLGADIVVQSATKHLGGHSDLTGGVVATNDASLAADLAFLQNAEGSALGPFDCWLLLRGIKTLALRMDRQQATAARLATWLDAHPAVQRVWYPGLATHPGADIMRQQSRGPGTVLSFTTGSLERSVAVVEQTRLFTTSVSFGSVHSLISLPCRMSHASVPAHERTLPEDLVRISAGIEDCADLLADLADALVYRSSDGGSVESGDQQTGGFGDHRGSRVRSRHLVR
jgi:cystathionine beta-lyase